MSYCSKLTQKYQVTIPNFIRQRLHLQKNDLVEFVWDHGKVILKKPDPVDWQHL
ncbi:MAG: AbrB/MazE/SpoVT family DNA-binding domain-containing protein, partial [Gammaproteobacteria bacterium]